MPFRISYFNDLRDLPNFGCRSTGRALEHLLARNPGAQVDRISGLDSVCYSGWDSYAVRNPRVRGMVPDRLHNFAWLRRRSHGRLFDAVCRIDSVFGGLRDYVGTDPDASVAKFRHLARTSEWASSVWSTVEKSSVVVINGEGTLIFGTPTSRDALYVLFVISLAKSLSKPVVLANAMITVCPYRGSSSDFVSRACALLSRCDRIIARDEYTYSFLRENNVSTDVQCIPDALFSWGERYRSLRRIMREDPASMLLGHDSSAALTRCLARPYTTISLSSSIGRHVPSVVSEGYCRLIARLVQRGGNPVLVETCAGDWLLRRIGADLGLPVVPVDSPLATLSAILAGSSLYVSGRYHPSVAAAAAGVPCVFLASNSHKTLSLQHLLRIETPREFNDFPTSDVEVAAICDACDSLLLSQEHAPQASASRIAELERDVTQGYSNVLHGLVPTAYG